MYHTPQFRTFIISFSLLLTVAFAFFQKKTIWDNADVLRSSNILAKLPEVGWVPLSGKSKDLIKSHSYLEGYKGLVVHFWATWCGPCEAELPGFVEFTNKKENKDINFVFVAVNDDEKKAARFIKRFKKLQKKNMHWVIDNSGVVLSKFGTLKVPETYVFDDKGNHLFKFVGPQSWLTSGYSSRLNALLKSK